MTRLHVTTLALVLLAFGCGSKASAPTSEDGATESGGPDDAKDADESGKAEPDDDEFEDFEVEEAKPVDPHEHDPEQLKLARAEVQARAIEQREQLEREQLKLDHRETELKATQAELEKRLNAIDALEKRLDERLGVGEVARRRRAKRLGELAKLIMNMTPQSAADMVGKMSIEDAQSLVLIMAQQNERKASKLLAALPGERAAALGQQYLDRDPQSLVPPSSNDATLNPPPP